MSKERGFTIVELLIVVVIIAILAAITVVSYNGIQNRSKTTSGQAIASQIKRKSQIYNVKQGTYPSLYSLSQVPVSEEDSVKNLIDNGTIVAPYDVGNQLNATNANSGKTVMYVQFNQSGCPSGNGEFIYVVYWDYTKKTQMSIPISDKAPSGDIGTGPVQSGNATCA